MITCCHDKKNLLTCLETGRSPESAETVVNHLAAKTDDNAAAPMPIPHFLLANTLCDVEYWRQFLKFIFCLQTLCALLNCKPNTLSFDSCDRHMGAAILFSDISCTKVSTTLSTFFGIMRISVFFWYFNRILFVINVYYLVNFSYCSWRRKLQIFGVHSNTKQLLPG